MQLVIWETVGRSLLRGKQYLCILMLKSTMMKVEMKTEKQYVDEYISPSAEVLRLGQGLNLMADFSIDGEVQDFNSGEELLPDA